MENYGSFQDFEFVQLKTTSNIETGQRTYEEGETIAFFNSLKIIGFDNVVKTAIARGGAGNEPHVFWETVTEQKIFFSQGVFSPEQLALATNSKLFNLEEETVEISTRESLETNEDGIVDLENIPTSKPFCYNKETGEKVDYELNDTTLQVESPFLEIIADYNYLYRSKGKLLKVGQNFLNKYFTLEGRTRIKDSDTGLVTTGIIKIPKLRLMSGLSIRLGDMANPVVGNFAGMAIPVGERGNKYISEFYFLDSHLKDGINKN